MIDKVLIKRSAIFMSIVIDNRRSFNQKMVVFYHINFPRYLEGVIFYFSFSFFVSMSFSLCLSVRLK